MSKHFIEIIKENFVPNWIEALPWSVEDPFSNHTSYNASLLRDRRAISLLLHHEPDDNFRNFVLLQAGEYYESRDDYIKRSVAKNFERTFHSPIGSLIENPRNPFQHLTAKFYKPKGSNFWHAKKLVTSHWEAVKILEGALNVVQDSVKDGALGLIQGLKTALGDTLLALERYEASIESYIKWGLQIGGLEGSPLISEEALKLLKATHAKYNAGDVIEECCGVPAFFFGEDRNVYFNSWAIEQGSSINRILETEREAIHQLKKCNRLATRLYKAAIDSEENLLQETAITKKSPFSNRESQFFRSLGTVLPLIFSVYFMKNSLCRIYRGEDPGRITKDFFCDVSLLYVGFGEGLILQLFWN